MLTTSMIKFLTIIQEDSDRQVAITTLDVVNEIIKAAGEPVVQCTGMTDRIMATVKDVMMEKVTVCYIYLCHKTC